jgi:hypothetical protein
MRRIIERVVTVVTTTTWTISWQEDPPHSTPPPGPMDEYLSQPQLPSHMQKSDQIDGTVSAKEVRDSEAKQ